MGCSGWLSQVRRDCFAIGNCCSFRSSYSGREPIDEPDSMELSLVDVEVLDTDEDRLGFLCRRKFAEARPRSGSVVSRFINDLPPILNPSLSATMGPILNPCCEPPWKPLNPPKNPLFLPADDPPSISWSYGISGEVVLAMVARWIWSKVPEYWVSEDKTRPDCKTHDRAESRHQELAVLAPSRFR